MQEAVQQRQNRESRGHYVFDTIIVAGKSLELELMKLGPIIRYDPSSASSESASRAMSGRRDEYKMKLSQR